MRRAVHARHVAAVLAAVPFLLLASMIVNFGVDVPYWDQWDRLVPVYRP